MKENWNEIESVFHAALEIPAARRREFLESKCSGNQRLLSDVESLIDSFESDSAFLNEPVFDAGLKTLERKLDNNLEGKTIGAYVIEERIGVGGMGEVYRAVDTRLDRTVALKFLSEDLENDRTARRRLEKEARAAAALDHPNICAVYGLEHIGRQQFIVMQHIKGVTLGEYLKERKLGIDEFRSLAKQIIGAVAFAHSHGVIHRDLKPGNIMVTADGSIKVLDFGLAKVVNPLAEPAGDDDSRFSTNGLIIGTVSYMSPEQLRGEKLDFRSDIFSLGIILCEILTGKNPFARPTQAETIAAIMNGIPQIPTDQTASHQRIRNLLHRCISPNRDVRPESGLEVQIGIESESIRTTWWRFGLIVPILILIVALLGIGYYLSPVRAAKPVVAVLPFRPEDGLQESRTRAESVSQSIIDRLARVNSISLRAAFLQVDIPKSISIWPRSRANFRLTRL
ncbi:MAG: serine/threonine protein kinase [Acidobacteria bacterium]|nr:serine/threonine protein kinase [Acidobacteriota bacterium]